MSRNVLSIFGLLFALVASACSSLEGQRNDSLKQVQDEQIALNNQVQSGLVQPGTPAYFNEVRRVRQRWVETYLPVVDSAFLQHNELQTAMANPEASAKARASASTELVDLRQKLYTMLVEVTAFNQQVTVDRANAEASGFPWHLVYPKCPNTPAEVFSAVNVQQIPGFQLAAAAPAQPQPVQYIPMAPAPQGVQGQQGHATAVPLDAMPTAVPVPVAPQSAPGHQAQQQGNAPQPVPAVHTGNR